MTAVMLSTVLAVTALSIDASYMYDKRNRLHAAADAAAKTGALEVRRNPGVATNDLWNFARQQVELQGFTAAACGASGTSVCIYHPPSSGDFAGNANYVEAVITAPTSTFFARLLGWTSLTPGARSVAGVSENPSCIVTLSGDANSFKMGNGDVTLTNCEIAVKGDLNGTTGTGTISAPAINISGACNGGPCPITNSHVGVPAPTDPLYGKLTPPALSGCNPGPPPANGTVYLYPGCYTNVIVKNGETLSMQPGIYAFSGTFCSGVNSGGAGIPAVCAGFSGGGNPTITGTGVAIYIGPFGQMAFPNNKTNMTLTPPATGTYAGVLMHQDAANSNPVTFAAGSLALYTLSGALYFPSAQVTFENHLVTPGTCLAIVAKWLWIQNGNSQFRSKCDTYGGFPLQSAALAE